MSDPVKGRGRRKRAPADKRMALAQRLWRAAELQVSDIEARLADEAREPSDNERNSRALAVLVKTLRELSAFDAEAKQQEQGAKTHGTHDDIPRDIDEFRRELSRRLDRLVAEAKAACPDEDAAG